MEDFDFMMFQNYLQNKKEQGVFARFYDNYEKTGKILENGLPEFRCVTYIEIRVAGDIDSPVRRATQEDMMRFPNEYNFYKAKQQKLSEGTPLNQFAFMTPAQIENCNLRGVFTVEALAGLDDEKALALSILEEASLAKKFLEFSKNNSAVAESEKKIEKLQGEIEKLKEQIAVLKDENKKLKEKK